MVLPTPRRWILSEEYARVLEGDHPADFEEALSDPERFAVKRSLRRYVLRIPSRNGGAGYYLKIHRPQRAIERLEFLLRPSRGAWEFRMAVGLSRAGVPVAEPVAYANARGGILSRGSFYVCREVAGAQRLSDALRRADGFEESSRLMDAYGRLFARIHGAGYVAQDLIADNVLVEAGPTGGATRLRAIDLHSTRPWIGRFRSVRVRNLVPAVILSRSWVPPVALAAFFRAYLEEFRRILDPERHPDPAAVGARRDEAVPEIERDSRVLLARVLEEGDRIRRRRWVRRTRWPMRTGDHFVSVRRDRFRILARTEVDLEWIAAVAKRVMATDPVEPGATGGDPALELFHRGGRANVFGVQAPGGAGVTVKFFHDRRVRARLRTVVGLAKGRRAYRNGFGLEVRAIDAPRVWAYAERRPFGPAILVTTALTGAERLDRRLERILPVAGTETGARELRSLARAVGAFTGTLHERGITHLDFSTRNLMVADGPTGPRVHLVDFEDVRFAIASSPRARAADLRLLYMDCRAVPAKERLRFLRHYAIALAQRPVPARLARPLEAILRKAPP